MPNLSMTCSFGISKFWSKVSFMLGKNSYISCPLSHVAMITKLWSKMKLTGVYRLYEITNKTLVLGLGSISSVVFLAYVLTKQRRIKNIAYGHRLYPGHFQRHQWNLQHTVFYNFEKPLKLPNWTICEWYLRSLKIPEWLCMFRISPWSTQIN